MAFDQTGYKAAGNITPAAFLKLGAGNTVTTASTGDRTLGIAQKSTRRPPYSTLDDGYAAVSGENVRGHFEGEVGGLQLGTGGATAGDYLKSDSSGFGVTASTNKDIFGARALQTGAVGDIIEVQVMTGVVNV